jgi:NADH-ubiquinone oxidoreductase chain 6
MENLGLDVFLASIGLKNLITGLAALAGLFVITTQNAIISVFNLIVLYILVAFYLIYIGITYLGISYIVVYIGAIAILFLFVIMMIDIEYVVKRSKNYLPLLLLLLGGFIFTLKNIFYNIGILKFKSLNFKEEDAFLVNWDKEILFNTSSTQTPLSDPLSLNQDWNSQIISSFNFEKYSSLQNMKEGKLVNNDTNMIDHSNIMPYSNINPNLTLEEINPFMDNSNYLLIVPDWDSSLNRITQISAIGDVLYTVYHSYIYIVSIILLLGMVGAIILTADSRQYTKVLNIHHVKTSHVLGSLFILWNNINTRFIYYFTYFKNKYYNRFYKCQFFLLSETSISPFSNWFSYDAVHSEEVLGTLVDFLVFDLIVGLLLLAVNSSFSLSVKYLEKGGGFECGFTSFVQTRERYNVIFYRVSLLFLVFDLEIILIFPFPALYQKDQNNSKNNVLAFLYILIIGLIYELKEGALNIVKTAHSTDIDIKNR